MKVNVPYLGPGRYSRNYAVIFSTKTQLNQKELYIPSRDPAHPANQDIFFIFFT